MSLIQKQARRSAILVPFMKLLCTSESACRDESLSESVRRKRQLVREGLSTRARELKAEIVRFGERRREQSERRYAVEIRTVSPEELAALDQPGSVFRLQ